MATNVRVQFSNTLSLFLDTDDLPRPRATPASTTNGQLDFHLKGVISMRWIGRKCDSSRLCCLTNPLYAYTEVVCLSPGKVLRSIEQLIEVIEQLWFHNNHPILDVSYTLTKADTTLMQRFLVWSSLPLWLIILDLTGSYLQGSNFFMGATLAVPDVKNKRGKWMICWSIGELLNWPRNQTPGPSHTITRESNARVSGGSEWVGVKRRGEIESKKNEWRRKEENGFAQRNGRLNIKLREWEEK